MCEMMHEDSHDKEEMQMEHILSENMRMIPEADEVDKYGFYLSTSADDWDQLHIQEHQKFIDENKLKPQFKTMMEKHIKKHQIQMKEKARMGIKDKSNNTNESEEIEYAD